MRRGWPSVGPPQGGGFHEKDTGIPGRRGARRRGPRPAARPEGAQDAVVLAGGDRGAGPLPHLRRPAGQDQRRHVKVEVLAAGQIVPAFEVLDAANKKVIDGFHSIPYYWVNKNRAAVLFAGASGRPLRHGPHRLPGLDVGGRRARAVDRALPEGAEAQPDAVLRAPDEPAGLRLVQAADQEPGRLQGHEVPPDRHQRRGVPAHGHGAPSTCRAARSCPPRSAA